MGQFHFKTWYDVWPCKCWCPRIFRVNLI